MQSILRGNRNDPEMTDEDLTGDLVHRSFLFGRLDFPDAH